jgi:hypothetical protein
MRPRSERRAARERAIAKAKRAYPDLTLGRIKRLADNRKPCSCWMCGNPRRSHKGAERIPIQERRAESR